MEMRCPHCDEIIVIHSSIRNPNSMPKGPPRQDLGSEAYNLINEKIKAGYSFSQVAKILESRKIKTPRGHSKWYPAGVRRIYIYIEERENSGDDRR